MFHLPTPLVFFLEASLWLGLGYACYYLLLRRSSWLVFSRFFLLGTLLASLVMPWVELPLPGAGAGATVGPVSFSLPAVTLSPRGAPDAATGWPWYGWLYGLGILAAAGRLLWPLARLYRMLATSPQRETGAGFVRVFTGGRLPTASFFRYLFWDETASLSPAEAAQVEAHELCHIRQYHSADLLGVRLVAVVLWFHPLIYLLERDLRYLHEYLADRAALRHGPLPSYRRLLLAQVFGAKPGLLHAFSHPPLKQRWLMMTQRSPRLPMLLRASLALILMGGMAALTSCQPTVPDEIGATAGSTYDTPPAALNLAEVYQAIGYPEALAQAGQEGQVLVKVLVDENGAYARHEWLDSPGPAFTEAIAPHLPALRFQAARQGDEAVSAWVLIPFQFKLAGGQAEASDAPKPLNFREVQAAIGYPEALREAGIQGMVVARILVGKDGRYQQHEIAKSDAPELQAAVEPHLAALQFEPLRDAEGQAVAAWVNLPFRFKLLE